MNSNEISNAVLEELSFALGGIDDAQVERLADAIMKANRIFVAGAGRSMLMIRGLAMRLMHLNFTAYVVGETVTPAIGEGDILIIGSGSGETGTLTVMAQKAKKLGAQLGLITIYPDSTIGNLADYVVQIMAATTKSDKASVAKSIQPGANTFEQSLLILGDVIVIRIMEKCNIEHGNTVLMKNHANLE